MKEKKEEEHASVTHVEFYPDSKLKLFWRNYYNSSFDLLWFF